MGLFSKLSIDGLLKGITYLIEQLHVVAEVHAEEAKVHAEIEAAAATARKFAEDEYARAKAIAAKFEALVKV